MHRLWQLTLCRVWLAQNNTSARQPAKSNQRKYFKRNDRARKEEAFAPLLKSGRLLLKSESQRTTLCQGHKGKLGWHACYFPSLLSSIIKKGTNWKDGNSEPSFLLTTETTIVSCPHVDPRQRGSFMSRHCWWFTGHTYKIVQRHSIQFSL